MQIFLHMEIIITNLKQGKDWNLQWEMNKIVASRMQIKKNKESRLNLKVCGQAGFINNSNWGDVQDCKPYSHKNRWNIS